MNKEEILKGLAGGYGELAGEVEAALLRIERMQYEALYEGLLALEEMREIFEKEEFPAKAYLLQGMEWLVDGTEPELLGTMLEHGIDTELEEAERGIRFLYREGLLLIQGAAMTNPYQRHQYFASFFPIEHREELMTVMEEYWSGRKREQRWKRGLDLLKLHYVEELFCLQILQFNKVFM